MGNPKLIIQMLVIGLFLTLINLITSPLERCGFYTKRAVLYLK